MFIGNEYLSGENFSKNAPTVVFIEKRNVKKRTSMGFNDQVPVICVHGQNMPWTYKWHGLE